MLNLGFEKFFQRNFCQYENINKNILISNVSNLQFYKQKKFKVKMNVCFNAICIFLNVISVKKETNNRLSTSEPCSRRDRRCSVVSRTVSIAGRNSVWRGCRSGGDCVGPVAPGRSSGCSGLAPELHSQRM